MKAIRARLTSKEALVHEIDPQPTCQCRVRHRRCRRSRPVCLGGRELPERAFDREVRHLATCDLPLQCREHSDVLSRVNRPLRTHGYAGLGRPISYTHPCLPVQSASFTGGQTHRFKRRFFYFTKKSIGSPQTPTEKI